MQGEEAPLEAAAQPSLVEVARRGRRRRPGREPAKEVEGAGAGGRGTALAGQSGPPQ